MTASNVDHIATAIRARVADMKSADEAVSILRDLVAELARDTADQAFWKVRNEGWSLARAADLSDTLVMENARAITDTIHQTGGSFITALDLAGKWVAAYGLRLRELHVAPNQGGHA